MPVARKLTLALDDTAAATLRTLTHAAEAVARRELDSGALADCLRQATSPEARHRGKVMVAALKRARAGGRRG
jgi:hypothetical protein